MASKRVRLTYGGYPLFAGEVLNTYGFEAVLARSTAGGSDTKTVAALDYAFSTTGPWA
ncbi:MAG: hypothetical protein JNM18_03440 [Planctomycetaceae bacterium]|nr:hypothetical protein [Planctomycetaceae bacterium]